jgi:carboxymethylenebutenolidase
MSGTTVKVRSRQHGEFDCYLALPKGDGKAPAIVLASAIMGVDDDMRELGDEFAAQGYIAAAPDLFWRSLPGPLPREDPRAAERSQPRLEKVRAGEADMADACAYIRALPRCNGRVAVMGFCYGGPYAILGPKRLGYDAGISCHGTRMLDFIGELDGVTAPVCIIWGDQDHAAPAEVLTAFKAVPARIPNVEVHIFPGVLHGFMMRDNPQAFSQPARDFSMSRALAMLTACRGLPSG